LAPATPLKRRTAIARHNWRQADIVCFLAGCAAFGGSPFRLTAPAVPADLRNSSN
jgi:hypothetical protein